MNFTRNFKQDLSNLKGAIAQKHKFSFSKYADGEFHILRNSSLRNIDNWFFDARKDQNFHVLLNESFKYNDDGYYIGISCPCCDKSTSDWYLKNKGSNDDNTTFANIFVNSNYQTFKDELLPLFNTFDRIFLVANKDSNLTTLKTVLNFTDFYGIGPEAFKTDLGLIDTLKNKINDEDIRDALFLFCSGPLGNVLAHKLWENNKNNTYIDIGSTLNIWTEKNIRDYQSGGYYSDKVCHF
jgi:hypothetical protein